MRIEPFDIRNSGATLYESRPDPSLAQALLGLARRAIERRLTDRHHPLSVPDLPEFQEKGACFVTLHRDGNLRGCIGSPVAWRSLAEDVADNAARAARSTGMATRSRSAPRAATILASPSAASRSPRRCWPSFWPIICFATAASQQSNEPGRQRLL